MSSTFADIVGQEQIKQSRQQAILSLCLPAIFRNPSFRKN